ncbi:hypothetical protein [Paraclostridium bifermentans]|uniref:hypothetical protein n=1 Tax=Paraclostridium bifermentans TaxID=1490 RepID=UPI00374EC9F1
MKREENKYNLTIKQVYILIGIFSIVLLSNIYVLFNVTATSALNVIKLAMVLTLAVLCICYIALGVMCLAPYKRTRKLKRSNRIM